MQFTTIEVIKLRQKHPDWTLEKIGKKCGVSKQRVYTILAKSGSKTASIPTAQVRCDNCGNLITKYRSEVRRNRLNFCNRVCMGEYLNKRNEGKLNAEP